MSNVEIKLSIRYTPTKPSQLFAKSKYPHLLSSSPSHISLNRDATGFSRDVCAILLLLTFFSSSNIF